jgi:dihydropteroate synthase
VLVRSADPAVLDRVRAAALDTGGVLADSVVRIPASSYFGIVLTGRRADLDALVQGLGKPGSDNSGPGHAIRSAVQGYFQEGLRAVPGLRRPLVFGGRTLVMGVVNVTPDSFSDGGTFLDPASAVSHAERMVEEGADIVDVGGESTRPGAAPVSPDAEWRRVGPVVERLHSHLDALISVDTRHAEVADRALAAGADLVNDVGGLRDPSMRRVLARSSAAVIAMHMRGTPATMQQDLEYDDVVTEVGDSLEDATTQAIAEGIGADRLIVDPGLGFGKAPVHNLELIDRLGELRSLGFPVAIGASRKSFLGWVLGDAPVGERLEAGVAAAVLAARAGADIVRTHDVRPTVRALALVDAVTRRPMGPRMPTARRPT